MIAAFRPLDPADVVLGQFDGYRQTEGIADDSTTDTYVAAKLWVDTDRWRDVPFVLRTGKRLKGGAQRLSLLFRAPDGPLHSAGSLPEVLAFDLEGSGRILMELTVKDPGPDFVPNDVDHILRLDQVADGSMAPYTSLIYDVLRGDRSLFTSTVGLEAAFTAFAPLLGPDRPAVVSYPEGSWGPSARRPADRPLRLAPLPRVIPSQLMSRPIPTPLRTRRTPRTGGAGVKGGVSEIGEACESGDDPAGGHQLTGEVALDDAPRTPTAACSSVSTIGSAVTSYEPIGRPFTYTSTRSSSAAVISTRRPTRVKAAVTSSRRTGSPARISPAFSSRSTLPLQDVGLGHRVLDGRGDAEILDRRPGQRAHPQAPADRDPHVRSLGQRRVRGTGLAGPVADQLHQQLVGPHVRAAGARPVVDPEDGTDLVVGPAGGEEVGRRVAPGVGHQHGRTVVGLADLVGARRPG